MAISPLAPGLNPFLIFLADRAETLAGLMQHRVEKRVALHERPVLPAVQAAVRKLLSIVPGVELVGPLPAELQNTTDFVFWAGVGVSTKEAETAAAFIKYLLAPDAARAIKAKGMEPGSQ